MRTMQDRGAIAFDYGNNIRTVALDAGVARTWWRDAKPIVDARCGRCHQKSRTLPIHRTGKTEFNRNRTKPPLRVTACSR